MPDIILREVLPDDCAKLVELIRELAVYEKLENEVHVDAETLRKNLFSGHPFAYALLAEADGDIAGFCLYFYNFSTFLGRPGLYIEDIYVRETYRGAGIGSLFFNRLREVAKQQQCGRMEWSVLDWNTPAIEFYRRLGAEPMAEWTVWRLTGDKLL